MPHITIDVNLFTDYGVKGMRKGVRKTPVSNVDPEERMEQRSRATRGMTEQQKEDYYYNRVKMTPEERAEAGRQVEEQLRKSKERAAAIEAKKAAAKAARKRVA